MASPGRLLMAAIVVSFVALSSAQHSAEAIESIEDTEGLTLSRPEVVCNKFESSSQTCQNLARYTVHVVNQQIRRHLNISYTHQAMAKYFDRDDVSFRGFSKFFQHACDESKEHAEHLMDYLKARGGYVNFKPIPDSKMVWRDPLDALENALALDRYLQDSILDAHWVAQEKNDPHLQHYFEGEHISRLVKTISKLGHMITEVNRLQEYPAGMLLYDSELYMGKR